MKATETSYLHQILRAALLRSLNTLPQIITFDGGAVILLGKESRWDNTNTFHGKALVLGTPLPAMLPGLGLRAGKKVASFSGSDTCPPATGSAPFTQSPAYLAYSDHSLNAAIAPGLRRRPFTRFDYNNEWNNLGFGRIRTDDSVWAASSGVLPGEAEELAKIFLQLSPNEPPVYCGAYLTLYDTPSASVLWCSRPVGPLDSTEWTVIERFISDWRADSLPCLPCLCHTPAGCRCVVTMRLDCDEAIHTAYDLFTWYQQANIPFSLAIKTSLSTNAEDFQLLNSVIASSGSLLSHTHNHSRNWGETLEIARADVEASRQWFAANWPDGQPTSLAVSPFHTNPPYAINAMEQAGITGFVSGIIHNDPEYLLGRAGKVPFAQTDIVSISQQSMLHGDCYKRQGRTVTPHITAFEAQYYARGIFGYLDHPFSMRYQYDWKHEEERIQAHQKLIAAIRRYDNVWFWNQNRCFCFVSELASIKLRLNSQGQVSLQSPLSKNFSFAYRYKGMEHTLS